MREGQNPAKFIGHVAKPEAITVAVLTYIPFLSGYYAQGLDVLKTCLGSIWENTDEKYDLMVFDNGSGHETVNYLLEAQRKGNIQFLILSEKNLGKGGAWNVIFDAAPGEIIAYSDSDALFSHGWLTESLALLDAFPDVGMVTSRPFRTAPESYSSTVEWAEIEPSAAIKRGQFIPWETFFEFDRSLQQDEAFIRNRYQTTEDVRISYQGLEAQAGASHWQFLARKRILQKFVPFDMQKPMRQVRQLDERVNEEGLLRLMITKPLAMNMSNTLRPVLVSSSEKGGPERRSLWKRFLEIKTVKRILLAIYNRIFRWYYGS
jgi:hypothetical protein